MMGKILFCIFSFFLTFNANASIPETWPPSLVAAAQRLMVMEMKQDCKPLEEDGLRLLDCQYSTSKPDKKYGRVVLFDISLEQWMSWIWTACEKINQSNSNCYKKVSAQIRAQSGGQIPWRGVIYEDIKPKNGVNEMYCFRYGISVAIQGLTRWLTRQPTEEEIKTCFEASDDLIYFVGKFPRPISLSVSDFQKMTGETGMTDSNGESTMLWLKRIAQILPQGIGDENLLFIDLWTKLNVKGRR
jgi:hypothetical protein